MNPSDGQEEIKGSAPVEALRVETVPRRSAIRRLWRAEAVYVVALGAFSILAIFAYLDPYFSWDKKFSTAFNWNSFAPPGLFPLLRFISVFGNSWTPYALTALTVIIFLAFRRRSEAAGLTLSVLGSAIINSILKLLISRPRPTPDLVPVYRDTVTQSFPSGHVTFYVCFFGFLFFVAYALLPRGSALRRLVLALTGLPVLLVGLSRIYLGAHWPSDTLGAYLWSGVWLAFSLTMYRRWKERRTLHGEEKGGENAVESKPEVDSPLRGG
ncbi:MAG TPA: phosphatase PAP2 family protein [Pyrinomonadaceae bacterium]|nr:phosphatase PAP2 family protein [Pyrinomonadaceae bacterium]